MMIRHTFASPCAAGVVDKQLDFFVGWPRGHRRARWRSCTWSSNAGATLCKHVGEALALAEHERIIQELEGL